MISEMKDSNVKWIGKVPKNWIVERLQWHMHEINDKNSPIKTSQILSLTNKLGVIPYEEKGDQGNKSKENYEEYKIAYPNTIVLNSMNVIIGSVGICSYFGCVSPVYYVFKENDGNNLEFINYIFQTTQFQKELRNYANGILEIRLRLSAKNILLRPVAFPPLSEQKNIVLYLNSKCSQINELISKHNQIIEKLEEYRKSIIFKVITKGINNNIEMEDSGIYWIGDAPAHWSFPRIKDHVVISNGSDPIEEGSVPVYGSGEEIVKYCKEFKNGPTVLLGRKGTLDKPKLIEGKFWNVDTAMDAYVDNKTNVKWFWYLCTILDIKYYSTSTVKPSMTQGDYYNMRIPYPLLDEQNDIVEYLDKKCLAIDKLIAKQKESIEKLEEYKKSLIYNVITGKTEVK